ncbi:MAG: hypothetical protein NTV97_01810 [Alphaproteobacteria bacterium]|nr:hypothetical protein [Alphaproteobacteria bacterium]
MTAVLQLLSVGERTVASRMLDRQDRDLFESVIDNVIDEIGITVRHELANTGRVLLSADMRKQSKGL